MKKKLIVLGAALVLYALIGGCIELDKAAVQILASLGLLIGMVSGDWKKAF